MYIGELWASCRRRWHILLALLVLSAGMLIFAAGQVKASYDAEASLLLVPPRNIEEPTTNRYLELSSLSDSVEVLARSMQSAETVKVLEDAAPDATYVVIADQTTSAPILLATATGPTAESATAMLDAILGRVPENLAELQETIGIRPDQRITLVEVSQDSEPKENKMARLRVLAVLAAGMLLASALLVAAIDGLLLRRASRRTPPDDAPVAAKPPSGGPFDQGTTDLASKRARRTGG